MDIRIIKESEIDTKLDTAIRNTLCICFPQTKQIYSQTRAWHGSRHTFTVIAKDKGIIIAHVGVVDRTIKVAEEYLRIAGPGGVCVLPVYRGRRLSAELLKTAMSQALKAGCDFGLILCGHGMKNHYAQCGFKILPTRPITRIDENGTEIIMPPEEIIAMYYQLKRNEFPQGAIHLQGNDW